MIKIIYGKKGAGKTKKIIESANIASETCKGNVAFLFNSKRYICDLKHQIRFIDTNEYGVKGAYLFLGFISGLIRDFYYSDDNAQRCRSVDEAGQKTRLSFCSRH